MTRFRHSYASRDAVEYTSRCGVVLSYFRIFVCFSISPQHNKPFLAETRLRLSSGVESPHPRRSPHTLHIPHPTPHRPYTPTRSQHPRLQASPGWLSFLFRAPCRLTRGRCRLFLCARHYVLHSSVCSVVAARLTRVLTTKLPRRRRRSTHARSRSLSVLTFIFRPVLPYEGTVSPVSLRSYTRTPVLTLSFCSVAAAPPSQQC
jgi:hypothetical protein